MTSEGASLEGRLSEVFASPIFAGSPLFTVLDEILLEFDAARLDAIVIAPESGELTLSSALEREREDDSRWPDSDGHDGGHWWENASEGSKAPDYFRNSETPLRSRCVISFMNAPLTFSENGYELKRLNIWIEEEKDQTRRDRIEKSVDRIRSVLKETSTRKAPRIGKDAQALIERSHANEPDQVLRDALASFDIWLRKLLLLTHQFSEVSAEQKLAIEQYSFLNEFFWVTKPPDPLAQRNKLACLKPVFLSKQWEFLQHEFEELSERRNVTAEFKENDIAWFDRYALTSESLFAAYPADTRMSVVIPNWTTGTFPSRPDPRRKLFLEITSNAQRAAAEAINLAADKFTTLFSVPVLVGYTPLFTVTMFLPSSFSDIQRAGLASYIRRLGGLFLMQLETNHLRQKAECETNLESIRHTLSERSLSLEEIEDLYSLSIEVINPIKCVMEEHFDGINECKVPLEMAARMTTELTRLHDLAQKRYEKEQERSKETVPLKEMLDRAIATTRALCSCHVDPSPVGNHPWKIKCHRDTVTDILSEVIHVLSHVAPVDDKIAIAFVQPREHRRIRVVFRARCSDSAPEERRMKMRESATVIRRLLDLINAQCNFSFACEEECHNAVFELEFALANETFSAMH